jgi:hypothetical protein
MTLCLYTIQHALLPFILNIKIHFDLVLVLEHHDLDLLLEHQGLDLEC